METRMGTHPFETAGAGTLDAAGKVMGRSIGVYIPAKDALSGELATVATPQQASKYSDTSHAL